MPRKQLIHSSLVARSGGGAAELEVNARGGGALEDETGAAPTWIFRRRRDLLGPLFGLDGPVVGCRN